MKRLIQIVFSVAMLLVSVSALSQTYPNCASAASDPDGDGWGWENNQSCKVVAQTTFPNCASAASDPDGDGWGWENNQSCKVVATQCNVYGVTYPLCTGTQSGWGWENNQSCIATADCKALPSPYGLITGGGSLAGTLHVSGKYLVDGDGKQVVLRGPEMPYRWGTYSGITSLGVDVPWEGYTAGVNSNTIREISKSGANAMRILGGIGNELDDLLKTAIVEKKMYVSVARVDWTNAQIKSVLKKYSKYIILHPRGEFTHDNPEQWRTEAKNAIKQIRALGYTSVIEIGTTGYGQNWATIAKYGAEVAASDPIKNTMFLVQMYSSQWIYNMPATATEIANFPVPVVVDACLFTSTYGNTPNTYKDVWNETWKKNLSSFYWDWSVNGADGSMSWDGTFSNLTAIGRYLSYDSPAALKYSVKTSFLKNAAVQ